MKAKNIYLHDTHYQYDNGVPNYLPNQNGSMFQTVVVCDPITKGNHRDPNSWHYKAWSVRFPFGKMDVVYPTWGLTQSHFWYFNNAETWPNAPTWNRTNLYNKALSRLNAKIRGELDLGISFAEAAQTRKMLARLFKTLAKARKLRPLPGGRRGFPRFGSTSDVANGYLEWTYGWAPLIQDVFGIIDEMFRMHINMLSVVHASATERLSGLGVIQRYVFDRTWKTISEGEGKASCRITVALEVPAWTLDRWTSLNPVSFAWELTPYSFVADWFFDVGTYVRNFETAMLYSLRFKSGYVSELYVYDGKETQTPGLTSGPAVGNPPHYTLCKGTVASQRVREFYRTKLTSYPLPRRPMFEVDLGSKQLLNLAALLRQLLK